MLRLALKMLFGDSAKYLMLVAGLAVATFLMAQQTAVFCGLMSWTKSTLKNVPAPIWVVEDRVEQVNETNPLLDTDVARVRSVSSVAWASPIYSCIQRVRLESGSFKVIQLIGIDANTLAGAPAKMLGGDLMKLRLPHSVIIDDLGVQRLAKKRGDKVKLNDVFEINDQEARVVGIADAVTSFTGGPYVWTTYERALQIRARLRSACAATSSAPTPSLCFDATLLAGALRATATPATVVVVNSQRSAGELARTLPGLHLVPVDGLAIARRHGLGRIVNSALLGAFARAIGAPDLPMLEATLREPAPKLKDANVAACEDGWRCADAQLRTEVAS